MGLSEGTGTWRYKLQDDGVRSEVKDRAWTDSKIKL